MQLKNVSPVGLTFSCFSLLNPLRSTLFIDIPILAFVSRSRDRIYYNIYVKMTEAAIKGRSTSCTFTCEALRSCLRKTTFQANYWRQTTGSGNKAPALSPELLQYRTYYQRLNQRRDGIDIAISPSPRSSNSASWSSYGLTRAITHPRIGGRRLDA